MPQTPQTFANHARTDPPFHLVQFPLAVVALIISVILLIRNPGLMTAFWLIVALVLVLGTMRTRIYGLKVQDRVIRLEERLRLIALLPESVRPRIHELTEGQLVALRFASDDELPALATRALNEGLTNKQIKSAIQNWRPDYFRI
jgi:hypothetical protein